MRRNPLARGDAAAIRPSPRSMWIDTALRACARVETQSMVQSLAVVAQILLALSPN